jgi:transglutaminase-like putative cysteine protease
MLLHIRHETLYTYDRPAHHSVQCLRLTPRRERQQRTLGWHTSAPGRRSEQLDAHGNITQLLTVDQPHSEIRIVVSGTVDLLDEGPMIHERGPISPLAYLSATQLTNADARIRALGLRCFPTASQSPSPAQVAELAAAVCAAMAYRPGVTTVADTAISALERGEGVCQDQTHVFLAACRAAGVPVRYVSGYLHANGGSESASASHAWADVWLEGQGAWYGIDVTHAQPVGPWHCRLAVGRDYLDAAPVRGVRRGGGEEKLSVSVHVATEPPQQQQQQ